MAEDKINDLVKEYAELGKDKNVDVASLMLDALQKQTQNVVSSGTKRWVYLVSIGIPPLGYLLAIWFFFRDEYDAKVVAYVCIALTTLSLVLSIVFFKLILSGSGTSVEQLQQIKPQDVYQLTQ